jgi:hypothetical protein
LSVLPVGFGSALGGYQIERSLRFNSADSAYLNRTFGSPTAQNTWTISCWLKRGALSTQQTIFSAGTSNRLEIIFASNNTLQIADASTNFIVTTPVYRDPSSWYHIVIRANGSGSAMQVYVNNVVTTNSTTNNLTTSYWNASGTVGYIGSLGGFSSNYLNGYLTEINFIDGQALTPSDFGETDTNTGVWKPKAYTGTYGTNGFFLKFADNSNTTAATLGKDSSGNGNNWTPNNFSVTAGVGNDSLVDSPTAYGTDTGVGGEVRGNYCTWSPIDKGANASTLPSNGNLDFTLTSASGSAPNAQQCATLGLSSGKWYWEVSYSNLAASGAIGIIKDTWPMNSNPYTAASGNWYAYANDGTKYNGSTNSSYGATWTTSDVIGIALDMDAGTITFYKNGSSQGQAFSGISGTFKPHVYVGSSGPTSAGNANFGQRAFAYTAPSGFKALCTQNLPTPTIGATSTTQANDYMNVVLYTGTNGVSGSVTGVGFQPDFVWGKRRGTGSHGLFDSVRGVQKWLASDLTNAEATSSTYLTSFNSDGFSYGTSSLLSEGNIVAWNWKANGAGGSNTAGTITSTVSANTTSGFSIVTYTGNGTSGATIGHGLGVAPSMIIIKCRNSGAVSWGVYHASVGNTAGLYLNLTNAATTTSIFWNNTSPTSSVFSVGNWGGVNGNTDTYVAYCFAPVAGYSAFGSYVANGSTDGVFVFCGFRPRFFLIKDTTSANDWLIYDTARNPYNLAGLELLPNSSGAEATGNRFDILSNGFKIRGSGGAHNTNGNTYIYAAFAETPAKFSLAR